MNDAKHRSELVRKWNMDNKILKSKELPQSSVKEG